MNKQNLLEGLNPEQREGVTHTNGPLLIVAGAGTGKTTVITRRIAWLVIEQGLKPSQILALTFTDKAAGEMEARVDQLLPYGYTDTQISTFHAFGDMVLREFALDLGLPPEFRVLGADDQRLFISDRFDDIDDLSELRPITNPRKYLKDILQVISRAKDELIAPLGYLKTAEQLVQNALDDGALRQARRQLDLARIYTAYENFKREAGVIDFGDQILMLVELMLKEPTIAKKIRERFRYILVDEFQDTNLAQYELVKLLLKDHHNLTVVGDDDQAIYKFRGAAVSNILGFLDDFPKATTVVLTQNYRSAQPILDAAYRLIRHNEPDRLENRLGIDKHLVGQSGGADIHFAWFTTETAELANLVSSIKKVARTRLNQIAILVRSNTAMTSIARALSSADINYSASSDLSFLDRPEIRGIVAFFRVLVHPLDSVSYLKLAFSPYYQFDPVWLLTLNDLSKSQHQPIASLLDNESAEFWQTLPSAGSAALRTFREDLARYRALIGQKNPQELLYLFLKDRGILTRPSQRLTETPATEARQLEMIQNLTVIFEAISRYSQAGRDQFVLTFVDQLDSLLESVVPPRVESGPEVDAVRILTVHAAKGLEFDVVFLPGLVADRFPARRRQPTLELPNEFIKEQLPTGDEHLLEERRLAYVALTRSKTELYLSGSVLAEGGVRPRRISPFVVEALGLTKTPAALSKKPTGNPLGQYVPPLPAPRTIPMPEHDGLLFLSPAMIETYLEDPYNFYWRYVLKAPLAPNRHFNYGNAIHAAIERFYTLRANRQNASIKTILARYEEAWRPEGFESQRDALRQFAHGQAVLRRFITRAKNETLPDAVEEEFTLTLPGVHLRGRIDALFLEAGEIRDFKTSQIRDALDAKARVKTNIPLKIYALAYQKNYGQLPRLVTLDFVEFDLRASRPVTAAEVQAIEQVILATAANIRAGRFEPNPANLYKDYD